ncbi:MAG: carboxypeptidase-like regulatory domain-containing protein [Muribaculaceae bacterium]|nr:carboxypeptidase-like regulatory domain-containing protein [Muribaculaceae bacterium]
MNLRYILPIVAGLIPYSAFAIGDITGKVINKDTGEPVEFATVQLVNATTGKPLPIGTNTDETGLFRLPSVKDGKYLVKVINV